MGSKKIAFITGGARGLGFEIARQLGHKSYSVFIGVRNTDTAEEKVESLKGEGIEASSIELDVGDETSIERAIKEINKKVSHLDAFVNNAGTFEEEWGTMPSDLSPKDLRRTFDVNFFGPFLLLRGVTPLIKKSDAGRIVNISSDMGSLEGINDPDSIVYNVMGPAYQASKVALNSLTALFAKELKDTPCKVNSASPGWCRTDMGTEDAPLSVEQGADTPVWLATLDKDGPTGKFFSSTRSRGAMEW